MRRGLSRFPVNYFCLTIAKSFIGSSSMFPENSGSKKFVWMWGGISRFPVDFVSTHNTENFHWELFSVSKKRSQRKVCMDERRGYHVFRRNFLNHSTGENHWEIFVVSETFWYGKKNMNKTGVVQFSVKHFLSPFTEKVHWDHFGV